jgi:long-chain fatty acid transport protein
MIKHRISLLSAVCGFAALSGAQAWAASGYGVGFESVTGAGTAYAGGAAAAQDASTVHYNPAGMSRLDHDELMIGMELVSPDIKFTNQGSTIFNGSPLLGSNRGTGGKLAFIPDMFYVTQLTDKLHVGIGLTGPWGLVTNYDDDWLGRYSEITTSVHVINVNPSLSYKISDQLSVGIGFDVQHAKALLRQAIDFGTVCVGALGTATCNAAFNLQPQMDDGIGKVVGRDIGFGFNGGILYQPTENLRFGAHYRSRVKLGFTGHARFNLPANVRAFFAAAGAPSAFTDTVAKFNLTIPEQASGSAYFKFDPRWAVMGDVTWTRWSRLPGVTITFPATPATPTNFLSTNWSNVFRFASGVEHYYSDNLTLRGGFAYDESPVPDSTRGPGIPDSDHYSLGTGASYRLTDRLTADVSYIHMFYKAGAANRISATGSALKGAFHVNVDTVGVGIRWAF